MDHNSAIGRQRRPSQQSPDITNSSMQSLNPGMMSQSPGDPEDLSILPASRFSGFKQRPQAESFDDPFARTSGNTTADSSRSPSPGRGGITPPGYQRRTNLSSGRAYGNLNASSPGTPPVPSIPRARISSVKDRVALFESRPAQEPNIPSKPASRTIHRPKTPTRGLQDSNGSKTSATSKVLQPQVGSRPQKPIEQRRSPRKLVKENRPVGPGGAKSSSTLQPAVVGLNNRASKSMHNLARDAPKFEQQTPLFGEIFSVHTGPGFGIPGARPRRVSDGSPMHSPNPMFSDDETDFSEGASNIPDTRAVTDDRADRRRKLHRRTHSDFTGSQNAHKEIDITIEVPKPWMSSESRKASPSANPSSPKQKSKIPVRARGNSLASDSADSTGSNRAPSSMDRYAARAATPSKGLGQQINGPQKLAASNRRALSPLQTRTSPNRQRQDASGPHLTASIIAPPPKVSPPLRSSRPRQPIWMASTAASRAKAMEESQAAQAQAPRRQTQKPPELRDVDFAARRSKIISAAADERVRQAALNERLRIEREKEVERQAQLRAQRELEAQNEGRLSEQGSSSFVEDTTEDEGTDVDVFETPTEEFDSGERLLTINTQVVSTNHPFDLDDRQSDVPDIDSPTLGEDARFQRLSVSRLDVPHNLGTVGSGPQSAVTIETEGTPIDMEPQVDFPGPQKQNRTVLSQIMQMREPSMLPPPRPNSRRSEDDSQSDKESVQIMLRNTAVFEEPDNNDQLHESESRATSDSPIITPSTKSWTSSIEEPSTSDFGKGEPDHASGQLNGLARLSNAVAVGRNGFLTTSPARSANASNKIHNKAGLSHDQLERTSSQRLTSGNTSSQVALRKVDSATDFTEDFAHPSSELSSSSRSERSSYIPEHIPEPLQFRKVDQRYLTESPEQPTNPQEQSELAGQIVNEISHEPPFLHSHAERSQPAAIADKISNFQNGANLNTAEDFEVASPAHIWSRFVSELDCTDSPTYLDDYSRPQPPPKDDDDLSDRATTPRAGAQTPLPSIESVTRAPEVQIRIQSPSKTVSTAFDTPPIPKHSPPPPPMGIYNSTSVPGESLDSLSFDNTDDTEDIPLIRPSGMDQWETGYAAIISPDPARPSIESVPSSQTFDESRSSLDKVKARAASPSPEQKRINKRRHVINEIVNTEMAFHRDMIVICHIYRATVSDSVEWTREDERIVFGNAEEVTNFAGDFSEDLKRAAGKLWKRDPKRNCFDKDFGNPGASEYVEPEPTPIDEQALQQANRDTRIGDIFRENLTQMEVVYNTYVKQHESSMARLQVLSTDEKTVVWLQVCATNSGDLTNAWDLPSLLVKPVQRFLKYPLLLDELNRVTDPSHPDWNNQQAAYLGVKGIADRINERKKQAEIVTAVINGRKRKESGVATALSKAFGRRTEKLKQSVGLSEYVEDKAYDIVKRAHTDNKLRLSIIRNDIAKHVSDVESAGTAFEQVLVDVEGWAHNIFDNRDYAPYVSKWLKNIQVVKAIQTKALPTYVEHMNQRILAPIDAAVASLDALERGIMAKCESRLLDYSRYKNALAKKGAKVEKNLKTLGEEYLALNKEAKQRIASLMSSSKKLVTLLLANLIEYEKVWWQAWGEHFRHVQGFSNNPPQSIDKITRDCMSEFHHFEAIILKLGICNGSLLAETVNLMSFGDRNSSFTSDNSPRQLSWSDAGKRSTSIEGSPAPNSRGYASPPMVETNFPQNSPFLAGRMRASSTTSGRGSNVTVASNMTGGKRPMSIDTSGGSRRPATSSAEPSPRLPRLSVETPSPSLGPFPGHLTSGPSSPSIPPRKYPSYSGSLSTPGGVSSAGPSTSSLVPTGPASPPQQSSQPTAQREVDPSGVPDSSVVEAMPALWLAASVYEFRLDQTRTDKGYPFLAYDAGELFDCVFEMGELWLARNQDDPSGQYGWIWCKHFAKLAASEA